MASRWILLSWIIRQIIVCLLFSLVHCLTATSVENQINNKPFSSNQILPNRSVIVQLFEWTFDDIGQECRSFLGPFGFGAVQVSPVLEYAVIRNPKRPWWERYQPVSYVISSRSGTVEQLAEMIATCYQSGVLIYVDLVINHMTGSLSGHGTAGTAFDGVAKKYPGVPYGPDNFNSHSNLTLKGCPSLSGGIESWTDPIQVRNCELVGLRDLNQSQPYVQEKIVSAINSLVRLGVAGFRVDASKHMWPEELEIIFNRVENLNRTYFPPNSRPFLYHEVAYEGGDGPTPYEYLNVGSIIEFRYQKSIVDVFRKYHNQKLKYLRNFGEGWGFIPSNQSVSFVDNHDIQRSRPLSGINFRTPRVLKIATAFMLAWPYGTPRVMSSYDWPLNLDSFGKDVNSYYPPPMDDQENIQKIVRNSDLTCSGRWRCEHRWRQIYNMVRFRNIVGNEPVNNWWDNDDQAIAFSRGSKGFITIVNQDVKITREFRTGLPSGRYCDVISGNIQNGVCSGKIIDVGSDGEAVIEIDGQMDEDPMIAIHVGSRLSN